MDKFKVKGNTRLSGVVRLRASKNAVLPILAASLLLKKGELIIHNVPDVLDVRVMLRLLTELGAKYKLDKGSNTIVLNTTNIDKIEAPYDLVRRMRASFMILGPLLSRFGKARVSLPGGCAIGARPVDQHIRGFRSLGAKITEEHGYVDAKLDGKLKGGIIYFDRPSHTGTENIIMGAVFASGETTIINAACDPEVVDLINLLNLMGARIYGAGTGVIRIEGVKRLQSVEYTPLGDRLEAGTYLFAGLATEGDITVEGIKPQHLTLPLLKMAEMGAELEIRRDWIRLKMKGRPYPVNFTTFPYPGFPTDLQAAAMAVSTKANGTSYVKETVFENRFLHVMELMRLGANLIVMGDQVIVNGVEELNGAEVMASDIRAGAGLVIAAMMAQGESNVLRVYHIDRGYERLDEGLKKLGANIKRTKV